MKDSNIDEKQEFYSIINDIVVNKNFQRLKTFKQHYETSCYEHCYNASYYSFKISKKLGLNYVSLTRAALLHDFFLYDWRIKDGRKGFHAFTHPKTSAENASILFDLSEFEKSIILTHMWPVTLSFPKSKEAFILTLVDKYCATKESVNYYKKIINNNMTFRYACLLLGFIIFKVHKFKALSFLTIFK